MDKDEYQHDYGYEEDEEPKPHDCPNGYAWLLLRLTSLIQIQYRIKQFISVSGFDINGRIETLDHKPSPL